MGRKVIQLSSSTLAATLPKDWVEANHIDKGDELNVSTEPGELRFTTEERLKTGETVHLDLTKLDTFEKNFISTLYQAGVDEIRITYEDPEIIPVMQQHIDQYCIGFDIVEQSEHELKIRSLSKDMVIDFEKMYRKNMQLMVQMMNEINDKIQQEDYDKMYLTRRLEERENKVQCLCLRYISKKGFPLNPKREKAGYQLIREIENICDCMKRICDYLNDETPTVSEELQQYVQRVTEFVDNAYQMYYDPDDDNAPMFFDHGRDILDRGYELLKTRDATLTHHCIDIINRTYFLSHPIVEIWH